VQTAEGMSLKSSEYMPFVQALDSNRRGRVDAIEALHFISKHCPSNNQHFKLDLKVMARYIEFVRKQVDTEEFLVK